MKKNLTDRGVRALKPAADGKPYEIMDTVVRGFGVRVMGKPDAPVRSFILLKRFPGSSNPTRRTLGAYGEITLEEAREKAREWLGMIAKGIDPAIEIERLRKAELEAERRRTAATFGSALEDYLRRKASKLRSGPDIERELRREFKDWMERPLSDISPRDVKDAIQSIVERGAKTQAHTLFALLRGFFNWVCDTGDYGLEISPCVKIKPTVLIGERNVRSRVLRDHELAAYWRACEALSYPFGSLFKLLLLTAVRRNEASEARWAEFDFEHERLWVVPGERMKNGAAHVVPLTDDTTALLEGLLRFKGGDYVFSTTGGRRPVSGFSKAKGRLDALMRADLEAQGRSFEHFVLHDIRRTARTKFSALPVEDVVREMLLAHARPGLHRVYDLHAYQDEKRHALELWHARLRTIVEPRADNVVQLAASA
jgi:integrase